MKIWKLIAYYLLSEQPLLFKVPKQKKKKESGVKQNMWMFCFKNEKQ